MWKGVCIWNKQCTATPSSDNNNTEMFDYILLKRVVYYQINIQLLLMKTWTDIVFNLNFNTNMECFFT